jgi:adenosylhomocysteine nucleosidase
MIPAAQPEPGAAAWGLVCALREELGGLSEAVTSRRERQGLELLELDLGGERVLAAVSGVGKVRAAQAAALLLAEGATRALLVVGVCGGLRRGLVPGTLVHCTRTVQTDLAVRDDREFVSDARLRAAWRLETPGEEGWFLTADRPVLSAWRRLRLARAFLGPCVADMETAAVAAVATRSGVPWAALRAVTDGASGAALASFRRHFPSQARRCADTVPGLLRRLRAVGG